MAEVTREDLHDFRLDLSDKFKEIRDSIQSLSKYQQDQNGRVMAITTQVAVHEERFSNTRDSKGRLFTTIIGMAVAAFAWFLHQFGGGGSVVK